MPDTVDIRIIIPRMADAGLTGAADIEAAAHRPATQSLMNSVLAFFTKRGETVRFNDALLRLPERVPAVMMGIISESSYRLFLSEFPELSRITVTARHFHSPRFEAA